MGPAGNGWAALYSSREMKITLLLTTGLLVAWSSTQAKTADKASGEVRSALSRVLGTAIAPSDTPLTGDFNGDGSPDLAVPIQATPELAQQSTAAFSNWTLEDPDTIPSLDPAASAQPLPPAPAAVHLYAGEPLLLILHGYGERGWRNPQARQAFLLAFPAADHPPIFTLARRARNSTTDTLCERNTARCLVWNGAYYVWRKSR